MTSGRHVPGAASRVLDSSAPIEARCASLSKLYRVARAHRGGGDLFTRRVSDPLGSWAAAVAIRFGIHPTIVTIANLGLALADYPGFRTDGFEIAALFDTQAEKIGQRSRSGIPIQDLRLFRRTVRRERIRIAVIAVPAAAAQSVLNEVVGAGIKAVLNFSPGALTVPADVKVKSVDLTVSLESLSFFLAQGDVDGP